jgi:glutamyl-tRNA synthetase
MSKRDVTSEQSIFVLTLRDMGYVPEAINNWVALMGASFGSEERLLAMDEMTAGFDLDHLTPSPARVNYDKLDYFNGVYLRQLDADDLARRLVPFFERAGFALSAHQLKPIVPLVQPRIVTLDDAVELAGFLFRPPPSLAAADLVAKGLTREQSLNALTLARDIITSVPDANFAPEPLETPLRELAEELGFKAGQLFGILRMAVTGQSVSPPLFETMVVLGRAATLERIELALKVLGSGA